MRMTHFCHCHSSFCFISFSGRVALKQCSGVCGRLYLVGGPVVQGTIKATLAEFRILQGCEDNALEALCKILEPFQPISCLPACFLFRSGFSVLIVFLYEDKEYILLHLLTSVFTYIGLSAHHCA